MRGAADLERLRRAVGLDHLGQGKRELAQPCTRHSRDLEHAVAAGLELRANEVGELAALGNIDLVERDELRALEQRQLALRHRVRRELSRG